MNLGKESERIEFKSSLALLDNGLKSLTAMLNRHNAGTVLFGVDDDGAVVGVDIGEKTLADIRNRISIAIAPRFAYELKICDEGSLKYISLAARGSDSPYSFDGRYYSRNGSSDEQASNEMLRKMLVGGDADIIRQIPSRISNLSFQGLCRELAGEGLHASDSEAFRLSHGLYTREDELNLLALLLSDQNPFALKIVVFKGTDKRTMARRMEYSGCCLLECTRAALSFVESQNETSVDLKHGIREEVGLFDFEAFREAWVNAVVHTSWHEGIAPAIYIFDDRMEIVSYGGLPYGLSREEFFAGVSRPVNAALTRVFLADRLAEQTGHGNPVIVARYGRQAFSFESGTVRVTLPFAFVPQRVMMRREIVLTEGQRRVFGLLSDDPGMTLAEAAARSDLSLAGVKKIVRHLQDCALLVRIGSARNGRWKTLL